MKAFAEVGCNKCHGGVFFNGPVQPWGFGSYEKFPIHEDPVYEELYSLKADEGRAAHTGKNRDVNRWRVSTLRNISLTAPYFHNGSVISLEEAVRVMAKTQLNKKLKPKQVSDIVEFLRSLTGDFPSQTYPKYIAGRDEIYLNQDSVSK